MNAPQSGKNQARDGQGSDVWLAMFTGSFGQQVIRAAHPVIVVAGEQVLGSFSTLHAAEAFMATQHRDSAAVVLRHQDQEWVQVGHRLVEEPEPHVKSGLRSADRARAPGLRDATLISNIEVALQAYPHIKYVAQLHYLEVPVQTRNGFRVWVRQQAGRYTLGFEKWHQEFTAAPAAFEFFMLGLSRICRLRVFRCGGVDYKWQVQRQRDLQWVTVSESGLVFYPFWWKRRERLLQNNLIKIT